MRSHVERAVAIAALDDVWSRLDILLAGLDERQWSQPTVLPGWDVKAVVAHLVGTEAMLLGEADPDVDAEPERPPHVHNDIGAFNERWVRSMAGESPASLLARFRDHTSRRLQALAELPDEQWEAEGFTPAGKDTYGRFMRIRVFDCWLHELDVRDAVGAPGGDAGPSVGLALEEMSSVMGYVVGKRAGAPPGSRVRFELTGPAQRRIDVEVAERAAVVDELSDPPTVTLTMPVGIFARLCGGRGDAARLRPALALDGDTELGERIVANLAYTI